MLPKGYGIAEEFPMSCNPDVQIKTIAQRIVAVRRFSGCSSHERCLEKLQKLHKRLVLDNLVNKEIPKALTEEISMKKPTEDGARCDDTEGVVAVEESKASDRLQGRQVGSEDALKWVVARYNSPCTLPVLRRNEVWIELSPAMPAVAALIDKAALLHTEVLPATQAGNRNSRGRRAKEGEEKGEEGNQIEEVEEQKAEEGKEEKKDGDELLADEIAALAAEAQSLVELGEQMDKVRQNES